MRVEHICQEKPEIFPLFSTHLSRFSLDKMSLFRQCALTQKKSVKPGLFCVITKKSIDWSKPHTVLFHTSNQTSNQVCIHLILLFYIIYDIKYNFNIEINYSQGENFCQGRHNPSRLGIPLFSIENLHNKPFSDVNRRSCFQKILFFST